MFDKLSWLCDVVLELPHYDTIFTWTCSAFSDG